MTDNVNHPTHYTAYKGLEIIQLTEQMNFNRGNAVKYIARAGLKNPATEIEDLEKAVWYTQREIDRLKELQSHEEWAKAQEEADAAAKQQGENLLQAIIEAEQKSLREKEARNRVWFLQDTPYKDACGQCKVTWVEAVHRYGFTIKADILNGYNTVECGTCGWEYQVDLFRLQREKEKKSVSCLDLMKNHDWDKSSRNWKCGRCGKRRSKR